MAPTSHVGELHKMVLSKGGGQVLFLSSVRHYQLKRNPNQLIRAPMIDRRKSFFVDAICFMLEGIRGSSSSGEGIYFDIDQAIYIQSNGTWGDFARVKVTRFRGE